MPKTITLTQLRNAGACKDQRVKFAEMFGESVEITEELCVKHAQDFSFPWASKNFLTAQARAEYDRVMAQAQDEFDRVMAQAQDEFDRVTAQARAEYDRVMAQARDEFDRVTAQNFARLYLAQD